MIVKLMISVVVVTLLTVTVTTDAFKSSNDTSSHSSNDTSSHSSSHSFNEWSPVDETLCVGNICTVTPTTLWHLQDIVSSDQVIKLKGDVFNVKRRGVFILLENISNLHIRAVVGTVINCSGEGGFGFYLKNVSSVTISGLRIVNCGVLIPDHLEQILHRSRHLPCTNRQCEPFFKQVDTTILIENSTDITISNIQIENSPGFGITAFNDQKIFLKSAGITITNSEISHSVYGSLIMYGANGHIVKTRVTNSSIGVVAEDSVTELEDVEFDQCTSSLLKMGTLVVSGSLKMTQSSMTISDHYMRVENSKIVFSGNTELPSHNGLTAIKSEIYIENESDIQFTRFNLSTNTSALILLDSACSIREGSTLVFHDNIASNGASVLASLYSKLVIGEHSMLNFSHNFVTANAWGILSGFERFVRGETGAVIDISYNNASEGGRIFEIQNTETTFDGTTVSLTHNVIHQQSVLFFLNRANSDFYKNSTLLLSENSALNNSRLMMVTGRLNFYDSTQALIENNIVKQDSGIIAFYTKMSSDNNEMNYYKELVRLHRNENDPEFKSTRSRETITSNTTIISDDLSPILDFPLYDNFPEEEGESAIPQCIDEISRIGPSDFIENSTPNINQGDLAPILDDPFPNNTPIVDRPIEESPRTPLPPFLQINGKNVIFSFQNNSISYASVGLMCIGGSLETQGAGRIQFIHNRGSHSSYVILFNNVDTLLQDVTTFEMSENDMYTDSAVLLTVGGTWMFGDETTLRISKNIAQNGFSVLFFSTDLNFDGTVIVTNNSVSDFGAFNVIKSNINFGGYLKCTGNTAESGALTADYSDMTIPGVADFSDNTAENGGAISLVSSVMYISRNATVNFTRNIANSVGGAIYITKPRSMAICNELVSTATSCSIQVLENDLSCDLFTLNFNGNRAGIAGNALYGGHTSACMPSSVTNYCSNCSLPDPMDIFHYNGLNDISDLSNFTSDPTRVCFCENGVPNCYKIMNNITVHPGEHFNLSLAVVGYGLGTVPGSIVARTNQKKVRVSGQNSFGSLLQYSQDVGIECQDVGYSILSDQSFEQITLAVNTQSFSRSVKEVEAVVDFQLTLNTSNLSPILRSPYDSIYETFFHIPIFVNVTLLQCPIGFQLVDGQCMCDQILLENDIDTCFINDGTPFITRQSPYWIGLPENGSSSSILIHPNCPFDYCQSDDVDITVNTTNDQCRHKRSGVLCGSCEDGLSIVLGSSECKKCSNTFLMLIGIFLLAGAALVALLTILNMTVSLGTLNGLILFANIIQANHATFLPPSSSSSSPIIAILSTFIAWINLDLGITTCFFDGLTTYVKTWLQFLFPLYILTIVGAIIIASKYSTKITKLFGTNAVSILATLVLLSYTKILRILISAFSFTTLKGTHDHYSIVWLPDGNVEYFELKHVLLFVVAFIVLVAVGIPYTVAITAAPWIQRSKYNSISSLYNKFKPLFDAYTGPYKDNCRYWTGMLLLARVILIVLFSSIANTNTVGGPAINLLLLTLSTAGLLSLTAAIKPYKTMLLNALEMFYLAILLVFSAANLYVSNTNSNSGGDVGGRDYIYIILVGISFLGFLGIGIGHIWYGIRSVRSKMTKTTIPDSTESDQIPRWRSHGRVSYEGSTEAETTLSTNHTTTTTSTLRDSMYRESVLELNNE